MSWFESAACRGMDPEDFHPGQGQSVAPLRRICAECPVRQECLEFALRDSSCKGFWGGMSERERIAERKRRGMNVHRGGQQQPIKHGTRGGYMAHQRRKEQACDGCRDANRAYKAGLPTRSKKVAA